MPLSLYDISIPVFIKHLTNLNTILQKAISYCERNNLSGNDLAEKRLTKDMFPLTFQVC